MWLHRCIGAALSPPSRLEPASLRCKRNHLQHRVLQHGTPPFDVQCQDTTSIPGYLLILAVVAKREVTCTVTALCKGPHLLQLLLLLLMMLLLLPATPHPP